MNIYQQFQTFLEDFNSNYPRNSPRCKSTGCNELEWRGTGYCYKCLDYTLQKQILEKMKAVEAALGGETLDKLKAAQDALADGITVRSIEGDLPHKVLPRKISAVEDDSPGFVPSDIGNADADVSLKGSSTSSNKKNVANAAAALKKASDGGP